MKQRSLNYPNMLQLLWKSFLCSLFFQKVETNYVPSYMKINYISTVNKGQCSVIFHIADTITLYFIVHSFHTLCPFSTCSLTSPVRGLRCIVFNNVKFC